MKPTIEFAHAEQAKFAALVAAGPLSADDAASMLQFAEWIEQNAANLAKQSAEQKVDAISLGDEDWRTVPSWPEYQCSRFGNVRRVKSAYGATRFKILKAGVGRHGYPTVSLSRPGQKKFDQTVHRVVVEAFIGPIPSGMDVCHYDGDKLNPCVENLRIDTRKGNMADSIRLGRTPRGQRCGSNRYPPEVIQSVRWMRGIGMRVADIAAQFDMPKSYIYTICNRVTWGWL